MTPASSLQLSLTPRRSAAGGDIFVTLEQAAHIKDYVTIHHIYRMWQRARSGIAAGSYKPAGCPISFEDESATIWLDFYVLPSSRELDYTLSASIGTITALEELDLPRERNVIFPLADRVELDFLPLSATLSWQSECYKKGCATVPPPEPQLIDTSVTIGADLFGVARLKATAHARKYRCQITLDKGDNRIKDLKPEIICGYVGQEGKTILSRLELVVPDCVRHALALCAGDLGTTWCGQYPDPPPIVYLSECDGSELGVRRNDPERWCVKL